MAIELYAFPSPNNFKVAITLELLGLEYNLHKVSLMTGEQRSEEYLKINPFGLVPAIKDGETVIGDSTNIVQYLVSKYDKDGKVAKFTESSSDYWKYNQYLFTYAAGLSSVQDKVFLFGFVCKDQTDAIEILKAQLKTQYAALDKILSSNGTGYTFGDQLSIADLVTLPQVRSVEKFGIDLNEFPAVKAFKEKFENEAFVNAAYEKVQALGF
ncbi:putative glutathione S-transferase zeta-class 2 [Wickerhamomyces ciferrii]|uniref:Glutathione S-transferase zeta-class 2 n=1 Tax=Wickerhamomyces ciferrii (strain ATCC 14091 / BCRC 22168 / CBS 111 / JCM 3599 / NBRC 0793 / NRRL Y-1031 F-60-10) TaxID=1206466 RepID=K0KZH6_WICCF|nr:putative glutathione S-transferase zeta-class 2 [Wickerhamomyces ciferrii]CCH46739.1 putative glutathione S-transferase zeta-class 2 [Wickerhamomyces ciferrii]